MSARTLRVQCRTWEQVEAFYLRKLRRGRSVSIRVPFVPAITEAITVGLELPTGLVVAIDGTITGVGGVADDRATVDIALHGLTAEVVDRLETLVADGRKSLLRGTPTPPPDEPLNPGYELVMTLDAELRRLRQLPVHEVLGVPWDGGPAEVHQAWQRLARRFHPDAVATHGSAAVSHLAEELMILVNRAYDRMRTALVAEGRAAAVGPTLHVEKGWLVAFDAISTGDVTPRPDLFQIEAAPAAPRRKKSTTGHPTVRFEASTEHVFDELEARPDGTPSHAASLASARATATGSESFFEKQARARLVSGDHKAAREVLAAALYVYPRNPALRGLFHVASAMEALDAGQSEHAAAQLEAALSADPSCGEARVVLDDLRRRGPRTRGEAPR